MSELVLYLRVTFWIQCDISENHGPPVHSADVSAMISKLVTIIDNNRAKGGQLKVRNRKIGLDYTLSFLIKSNCIK